MSVYVDSYMGFKIRNMKMCHMLSKDIKQLHAMADAIGIDRKYFQTGVGVTPHYDICQAKRILAIKNGALECDRRKVVEIIVYWRGVAEFCEQFRTT